MNLDKPIIGILYNVYEPSAGRSNEHISEESVWVAANDVFNALSTLGYPVVLLPLRRSLDSLLRRIKTLRLDVIVNLCEGFKSLPKLEANIASLLELIDIPFTGNRSRTLAICQDKFRTKAILHSFGLPTVKGKLVEDIEHASGLTFPMIVKPNSEDASLGIYNNSVVYDEENLKRQVHRIITTYNQPALVEEYIKDKEFNAAIKAIGQPMALPISEIDYSTMPPEQPRICGYEAKWFEKHELYRSTVPICPARIDHSLSATLQKLAIEAFKALECRHYARIDFRMNSKGEIFILEVNPNPDISLVAGYARALKAAGIKYHDFWQHIIQDTLARKE